MQNTEDFIADTTPSVDHQTYERHWIWQRGCRSLRSRYNGPRGRRNANAPDLCEVDSTEIVSLQCLQLDQYYPLWEAWIPPDDTLAHYLAWSPLPVHYKIIGRKHEAETAATAIWKLLTTETFKDPAQKHIQVIDYNCFSNRARFRAWRENYKVFFP
jgi:hypothetical protein